MKLRHEFPATLYDRAVAAEKPVPGGVHILGIPFDGTACFRKGTLKGPDAIRYNSQHIETYSPSLDLEMEDYDNLYDLGNYYPPLKWFVEPDGQATAPIFDMVGDPLELARNHSRIMVLGGEHSVSYGPLVHVLRAHEDCLVLHLDAHGDLRDGYEGYHYSHASVIRRVLEHFGPGHTLVQGQIRSGTRDEFRTMRQGGTLVESLQDLYAFLERVPPRRPVYLTLDLDWFDPACLPGTGTPEPGGVSFADFIPLVQILRNLNLVGCDVVELAPELDPTGVSSVLSAKVVRDLLLVLCAQ
ncbi:agmatinase [Myxococcota bacterium]|nr:agmatinase [Myxococcota bacterium]MBU1536366.1 agmatinase [Myxococcota bacterium]